MPGWKSQLSPQQIAAVISYIRSSHGNNHAGPITAAQIGFFLSFPRHARRVVSAADKGRAISKRFSAHVRLMCKWLFSIAYHPMSRSPSHKNHPSTPCRRERAEHHEPLSRQAHVRYLLVPCAQTQRDVLPQRCGAPPSHNHVSHVPLAEAMLRNPQHQCSPATAERP